MFITTLGRPRHQRWNAETKRTRREDGRARALFEIVEHDGPGILNAASGFQAGYVDILGAAILARRGHRVLLTDATWQPGSRALERFLGGAKRTPGIDHDAVFGRNATRRLIRLVDHPNIHYCVLSRDELATFPTTWGIDTARVHFTAFCSTVPDPRTASEAHAEVVFAGGNSLRDYRPLAEAIPLIDWPVTIATNLYGPARRGAIGPLPRDEYAASAASASICVVALKPGTERSAGQQTYLNAMLNAQTVVVTEAPGVRDYIDDGRTGFIVENDPGALAETINRVIADPDLRRRVGAAARGDVLAWFSLDHYFDRLLEVADRMMSETQEIRNWSEVPSYR